MGKTLLQLREERREAEEHAEAVRREMLAQELAEAEAQAQAQAAAAALAAALGRGAGARDRMVMEGDEVEELEELEEAEEEIDMMDAGGAGGRDLDEDIPDADEGGFGYDGISDEDDEEEIEEEEEGDEVDSDEEAGRDSSAVHSQRRAHNRELTDRMTTMRAAEDRMRQMMARGPQQGSVHAGGDLYDAEEDVDEGDHGQMLEEEDLVGGVYGDEEVEPSLEMDMEANLDDDIPEAETGGGYEHTDSEAELSSDDDGGHGLSYRRSSQILHHRNSLRRGGGPRSSLDISGFLSRDGSSFLASSPHVGRRNQ